MKKTKVLQFVEDLKAGGIEKVVADIAENLNEEYEITVWCAAGGGEIADELAGKGIEAKILGLCSYYNPFNILRLAALFKKFKPDILHTHTYFTNTMGRIAARLAGIPVVITHVHNTYWHYTKRNLFIERLLSRYSDKIVCCSEAVKDFVLKLERVPVQKVVTIYNGVALDGFEGPLDIAFFRQTLGISEGDVLITTVASLTSKKGLKYLLEALPDIIEEDRAIKCLIVGDGPLRKELEEHVKTLKLDPYVIFSGVRNDVPDLLRITDIFVLPSLIEGFGLAAVEAMAAKLPVVATNVGGVSEVVQDKVTGILVPPMDPDALSGAIKSLLKDNQRAAEMGEEGYRVCGEKFSSRKMIGEIRKLYDEYRTKIHQ